MSNTFTLDALHTETKRRYEPVKIVLSDESTVELKPLIRLGSKARASVIATIREITKIEARDDLDDDEEDELADEIAERVCEAVTKIIRSVASSPRKLLAQLDAEEDVRIRSELYTGVLRRWTGDTQVGEAESSPS
ncbi:hypothetical protein ASE48_08355 [Mycobacterium sp. Root265]|uniref:phage tail assembly protein n=1 Tax=Mycobacterium sp. Root265 TaxID=1736504 RepID=UPI0007097F0F|nr:phage tail assembly protein [Mycobacterium sp. Root265]KRD08568.1 hypothetical protein ASE48_08355 [Mycobacterium sp. Root265]